jgi:hypothetical protein
MITGGAADGLGASGEPVAEGPWLPKTGPLLSRIPGFGIPDPGLGDPALGGLPVTESRRLGFASSTGIVTLCLILHWWCAPSQPFLQAAMRCASQNGMVFSQSRAQLLYPMLHQSQTVAAAGFDPAAAEPIVAAINIAMDFRIGNLLWKIWMHNESTL